jgi:hypothetical protein
MRKKKVSHFLPIVALDSPEGGQNEPVDSISLFNIAQGLLVDLHHLQSVSDTSIVDQRGHIIPDRQPMLRLGPREPHGLFVEFDIAEGGVDDISPDAGLQCFGTNSCHAFLKRRCSCRIDEHACRDDDDPSAE